MNISRRRFLKRMIWSSAALAAGGAVYPLWIEPHRVEIRHLQIPVPRLPGVLSGLTIVQMSDLHCSRVVRPSYLADCIERANALQPDLVVFTGDYLTHSTRHGCVGSFVNGDREDARDYARQAARCMGSARARLGVFACLGNHDHWFDTRLIVSLLQDTGVTVLSNANTTISIRGERLPVVGLEDLWTIGPDIPRAFAGVDAAFALVLMHNPDTFEQWSRPGHHLILAGHTHGGQVNIPFFGPPILPSRYGAKYAHGLFRRNDALLYVNRGLGMIYPPVRFNCRPEISVFHLQSA